MVARPSRSSSFLSRGQDCVDGHPGQSSRRRLGRISRSADGRFVLTGDSGSSSRRNSGASSSGSSDDGGFLSHPSFSNRTWSRQPLLTVSGGSNGSGPRWTTEDCAAAVVDDRRRPIVVVATVCDPRTPYGFDDRPAGPSAASAADDRTTLQSVHERYSQQLPSLRAIHEENHRTLMHRLQPASPRYHPNPGRYRSRHMRYARSAPELTSDVAPAGGTAVHNNTAISERSPESRSSSSGFGSKNTTSSVQHQNTGGTASVLDDWCGGGRVGPLPPYKHPPPPPPSSSLFYADGRWLDYGAPHATLPSSPPLPPLFGARFDSADSLGGSSTAASDKPPLSVDDQYEFDPVFPLTPTPTELLQQTALFGPTIACTPSPSRSRTPTQLKKAKYDSVEARLRAMKEEFHAYKRRQAQMAGMVRHQQHPSAGYVESAC